jgi:hypothetical protein
MNQTLPTLELIQIATPCEASWEDMRGDDRVRFCGQCKLHVYNISDMPRDEAEKLVREREGRLCVRMFRRHDGTVLTRDCPVGLRAVRQRLIRSVAALAGLLLAMIGGTAFGSRINRWLPTGFRAPAESLAEWVDPTPPPTVCGPPPMMGKMMMGDVALPPPPVLMPPVPVVTVPIGSEASP